MLRALLDTSARCCPLLRTSACATGGVLTNWLPMVEVYEVRQTVDVNIENTPEVQIVR
jgi:hypothetical protein